MAYDSILAKVPALASPSNPPVDLIPCRLFIKYSASLKQAAIFLHLSLHIYGSQDARRFVLVYQADNLSSIVIQPATEELSQDQRSDIARHKNTLNKYSVKSLRLTLRAPCAVQCPPSTGSFAPKPDHERPFSQLRNLASAKVANILFDDSWIGEKYYDALWRLTTHPERFIGIVADGNHASKLLDWTAFAPTQHADEVIAKEAGPAEAPPRYTNALGKRAASSSPPSPPSRRKRYISPPTARPVTPRPPLGSPTEIATATTTGSPNPPPASPSPRGFPGTQQLIFNAIQSLLPAALQEAREADRHALKEELRGDIQKLSAEALRSEVKQILPDVLAQAFATQHVSPDKKSASVGSFVAARIASIAKHELDDMHYSAQRDAVNALEEAAEDLKADMEVIKADGITELQHESEKQVQNFVDVSAEVVAQMRGDLEDHADDVYCEAHGSIKALVEEAATGMSLREMRMVLARGQRVFKRERAKRLSAAKRRNMDGGGEGVDGGIWEDVE